MVRSEDMPAVTAFTEEFARVLCEIVDSAGVSRQSIAEEIGRSRSFVSDQLLGKRPVDTDVLSAIAAQFGVSGRFLARQVLDQLPPDVFGIPGITRPPGDDGGGSVTSIRPRRPKGSGPSAASRKVPRVAKASDEEAGASEFED